MEGKHKEEVSRQALIASGILVALEGYVLQLQEGFTDGESYLDSRRTLDKLRVDVDILGRDIRQTPPT